MSTNFPVSLDTLGAAGTLGGPFIDAAPPVDPFVDIAADFRSNSNDAMLAVQSRVGLTNSIDSGSLSWATISVGGVNNLGLRFAQEQSEWPGTVGESGIFFKDGTFEPMFHRGGEAKATFYPIVGVGTLQTAYDVGNTIVTSGGRVLSINGTENFLWENSATNVFQIGTGATPSTNTSGMVQITHGVGADGVVVVNCDTTNLVGNNGLEFGAYKVTVTDQSDLNDTDIIYAYQANLDMQGDGPVAGFSLGAAFFAASSSFSGANVHLSTGLYVDASYNYAISSYTGASNFTWGSSSEVFFLDASSITGGNVSSDGLFQRLTRSGANTSVFEKTTLIMESTGNGGDQLGGTAHLYLTSTVGGALSPLLAGGVLTSTKYVHQIDAADDGTAWHEAVRIEYQFPSSGGSGVNDQGSSAYGVYASIPESISSVDGLYHNNDGTYTFTRWAFYVENGESHFRRTEFTGPSDLGKALIRLDQTDVDRPFYELEGRHSTDPKAPNCNLADNDTGGIVVGPKASDWSWLGMYQVYVIDGAGHIASGHYWVPLYQAI